MRSLHVWFVRWHEACFVLTLTRVHVAKPLRLWRKGLGFMKVRLGLLLIALALVSWSSAVGASPILAVVGPGGSYPQNTYAGANFTGMAAQLNAAFGGSSNVSVLSSAAGLMGFDAVWVDQRYLGTLTSSELSELSAFAAAGRRMVMIGENNSWDAWNQQILGIGGGGYMGGCFWPVSTPALVSPLTAGVSSVEMACGSYATGGTSLFSQNFATLWGAGNVLTILDSNMLDDAYRTHYNNAQFAGNVATWLAGGTVTTVPDAGSSLLLLGIGLGGLRAWKWRLR